MTGPPVLPTLATPHGLATLADFLRARAANQPDKVAFTWLADDPAADVPVTYAWLDARARGIASLLQAEGAPGERALLLLPPGLDFVAALFGCFYAGWVAVPAYPPTVNQRLERLQTLARDSEPRVALTTARLLTQLAQHRADPASLGPLRWRPVDFATAVDGIAWRGDPAVQVQAEALAVLQYTSGSTAAPRGVMLSHANLLHNVAQIARRFDVDAASRGVIWLPPYHDMGLVGGILEGVFAGFPVALLAPVAFLQRPARWLQAITRTRATISGGPNFAYDLCVDRIPAEQRTGLDLATWQVAFNGAEPVREATLRRFTAAFAPHGFRATAFYPCYGLAEATLMVAGGCAKAPPVVTALEDGRTVVGSGHSIADQHLVVVDPETHADCPPGQTGELWVAGPSVAAGYWRRPALSKAVFNAYLPNGDGPFLRTGDLGFVRDGEVFVTGRLKAVLIVHGRKLQAEDLEASLADLHPGGTAAALTVEEGGQERLVILHELDRRPVPADFDALVHAIRVRIAEAHQVPVWRVLLVARGSIPKTSSGKLQRGVCRAALLTGRLATLHEWQATQT